MVIPGLIEMHCHILPGVDDGSKDTETSVKMLRRLAHEQHKSILLSTHDVELALQLSDRLWLMEESRFSIGTPKELAADGSLSRFINRDGIRFNKDSLRIEIK